MFMPQDPAFRHLLCEKCGLACLALAPTTGWCRRCCGARHGTLLATLLDLEQGTSEKIVFQSLFRQCDLQLGDLIPERFLFAFFCGYSQICVPRFRTALKLVFPGVKELPLQLQLAGQSPNVWAGLHPLDDLPFELHRVATPLRHLGHCASIQCKVRLFGVSQKWGSVHKKLWFLKSQIERQRDGNLEDVEAEQQ